MNSAKLLKGRNNPRAINEQKFINDNIFRSNIKLKVVLQKYTVYFNAGNNYLSTEMTND